MSADLQPLLQIYLYNIVLYFDISLTGVQFSNHYSRFILTTEFFILISPWQECSSPTSTLDLSKQQSSLFQYPPDRSADLQPLLQIYLYNRVLYFNIPLTGVQFFNHYSRFIYATEFFILISPWQEFRSPTSTPDLSKQHSS